ncbi:MAG: hypothetical protein JNL08_17720 [Planctomycetes bacterium]|nr:hypothetical protein [Planctomycetota bacterium]
MTETEPVSPAATDSWDALLEAMRRRYPGQKDSVLFCIHKLQQNPDLTLKDFREEAALHRIPMAGRSLHSARVLLGLQKEKPAEPVAREAEPAAPSTPATARARRGRESLAETDSIEQQVVAAMRRMQTAAGAETERLRDAIRQAIALLQRALAE